MNRVKKLSIAKSRRKASQPPKRSRSSTLAQDVSRFLREIGKHTDRDLIRKNVKRSQRLFRVLKAASPRSSEDLLSGIAVDLADFWDIGKEHQKRVAELRGMRFPRDRRRFIDMLAELEVGLVTHAEYHVKTLKRHLARLKKDLKLT